MAHKHNGTKLVEKFNKLGVVGIGEEVVKLSTESIEALIAVCERELEDRPPLDREEPIDANGVGYE